MGAWGYSIFENDAAQEVAERWADWIDGPKAIGYDKAIERFFKYWGDAIKYGDPITNSEIIALLGIHLRSDIEVPKRLRTAAIVAISNELEEGALSSWDEPEKREAALRDLLNRINAEPTKPKRPAFFKDSAFHYKDIAAAKRDLVERARRMRKTSGSEFIVSPKDLPPFLKTLHRFMHHRVWEKDYNIAEQARIERCMMLGWYVAMSTGMSSDELEKLLDRIVASHRPS